MKKISGILIISLLLLLPMYVGAAWLDSSTLSSEPASMLVLGVGLMGLGVVGRSKFFKK